MKLEQMFESYNAVSSRSQRMYDVGELGCLSASMLYGDMDRAYDFRESGFQLHIHEDSRDGITGANIKPYGEQHGTQINNYEALMGEARAQSMGIPMIDLNK